MEEIICKKCGCINDYRIEVKSNNHAAYCNGCGGYIKNIPYDEPRFYFGKYHGMKISECDDKPYMEWVLANTKRSKRELNTIRERIAEL